MILYRFSPLQYAADLSGEGSKRFGGRWNSKGFAVVYTSTSISLSLIELFIHSISYQDIINNRIVIIDVPDKNCTEIKVKSLKTNWQADIAYTQYMGDQFLSSCTHLLLKVPSAIIPEEFNYLINPAHPDFSKVTIHTIKSFSFDTRLFKNEHTT
jgi:RES domain-containing protein